MERNSTRKLVIGGIMVALSVILSMVKVWEMPQGGSITAGSMVPIIIFSLIFGLKDGLIAALAYGIIQFIIDPQMLSPFSVIIDYILGFGVLGLAGIFHTKTKNLNKALIGSLVASILRFVMLFISGVVIWGQFAPEDMPVWKYSLVYNGTYMVPEIILTVIIIGLIYNKIFDAIRK